MSIHPPPEDIDTREMISDYALHHSHTDYAEVIKRLNTLWHEWNDMYFEGRMNVPVILLVEPGSSQAWGDTSTSSGFGCRGQIRVRPAILKGTLAALRHGTKDPRGLRRFLEDVLRHEMIHQWAHEVTGTNDLSYNGHGPAFSAVANKIGAELGLPPVNRTNRKRDGDNPSPAQWPHIVRPHEFYYGAYQPDVPAERDTTPPCPHCGGTGRDPDAS